MRWALLVLAACGFEHGALPGTLDPDARRDGIIDTPTVQPSLFVRRIDLDDTKIKGGPHPSFPLLVSLNETWLRTSTAGGDVASNDGADIWFSADQQNLLDFELEHYAPDTGVLIAWVRIPSLTAQSVLYIHYGNAMTTTSAQNAPAVWSGDYEAVYHCGTQLADATAQSTPVGAVTSGVARGKIFEARTFDGADDTADLGSATVVDDVFSGGGTIEGWFNAQGWGGGGFGRIIHKGNEYGWSLYLWAGSPNGSLIFVHGADAGVGYGQWYGPLQSVTLNAWHHVAVVYNRDSSANLPAIFLDGGALAVTVNAAPTGNMVSDATYQLRAGNRDSGDRSFDGQLDELRLSSGQRSDAWLATQFTNYDAPGAFYTVSEPL